MSKEQNHGETPTGTQREFREYALGNLEVDHDDVHPIAGLGIPPEIRQVLMFMADNYEPPKLPSGRVVEGYPREFWETDFAQRAIRKHATDTATRAVRDDNVSQLATMVGDPSHESDISGLHEINDMTDWLVNYEETMVIYIASLMGRGKTDISCLFYELIWNHYKRLRNNVEDYDTVPRLAANFHVEASDGAEVELIDNYDDMRDEFFQEGSSEDEKWFIFDEASSELTAQDPENAQKVVQKMGSLVKKMRKHGVNLVVIGHDRQDVHVAIRSLCKYVDKTSKKQAKIYEGIQQRKPDNLQLELSGIPQTSWDYDTDDTADWSWGDEEGLHDSDVMMDPAEVHEEIMNKFYHRAAEYYLDNDVTQQQAVDMFSGDEIELTQSTLSNRVREMRDIREMKQSHQPSGEAVADD